MEPESEQEKLPQDRWYWGWYGIFITLMGVSPFIPVWLGVPCFVIGIGGFFVQMREGFMARMAYVRQIHISRAQLVILMRAAAVGMLIILGITTVSLIFETKDALDTYVMPRAVTEQQAKALRKYLSQYDKYSVTIKVDMLDEEAREYAGQLYEAFKGAGWKPEQQFTNEPLPVVNGLFITTTGVVVASSDPDHDPGSLLQRGLQMSDIPLHGGGGSAAAAVGDFKLFLLVGRRPLKLGDHTPLLDRVGDWFHRHAR
jgi:hypothetical protein